MLSRITVASLPVCKHSANIELWRLMAASMGAAFEQRFGALNQVRRCLLLHPRRNGFGRCR
jgi:hypothetical protein